MFEGGREGEGIPSAFPTGSAILSGSFSRVVSDWPNYEADRGLESLTENAQEGTREGRTHQEEALDTFTFKLLSEEKEIFSAKLRSRSVTTHERVFRGKEMIRARGNL